MLTTQDRILIEQRITNEKPSVAVAYLLLLFLWPFGGHRFYLGRIGSAIIMVLLSLTIIGLVITAIWTVIDLFLIPGIVREKVEELRRKFTMDIVTDSSDRT